jgi:hypothetical protein
MENGISVLPHLKEVGGSQAFNLSFGFLFAHDSSLQ